MALKQQGRDEMGKIRATNLDKDPAHMAKGVETSCLHFSILTLLSHLISPSNLSITKLQHINIPNLATSSSISTSTHTKDKRGKDDPM